MTRRFRAFTFVLYGIALVGCLCGTASAQAPAGQVTAIMAGTDYLQTTTGSQFTFPSPTGSITVPLKGIPIKGKGNSDTVIARKSDAKFASGGSMGTDLTATVQIQLMQLQMQGTFTYGGATCNVTITIGGTSTGTVMFTLNSSNSGGTFTTTGFTVNYTAVVSPASCPQIPPGKCTFSKTTGNWVAVPPSPIPTDPPFYLVTAAYPNLAANLHTGAPPGFVDFFITGVSRDTAATAKHVVCEAASAVGGACPQKP